MIPQYLRGISAEPKVRGCRTTFSIVCGCGNDRFDVFVNANTPEEKKRLDAYRQAVDKINRGCWAMKGAVDDRGVMRHWKYLAPGIRMEVFPPEEPSFVSVVCWKLRCSGCGREHLIFDNRYHGYEGVFCGENADRRYQPVFQQRVFRDRLPRRIEITTENEKTREEFLEKTGIDCDEDTRSNAFAWISVQALDSNGKRTRILDAETA